MTGQKLHVMPIIKTDKKENLDGYGLVSLFSVLGREQVHLVYIARHVQDKRVTRSSQHRFSNGKSGWMNLLPFTTKQQFIRIKQMARSSIP